MKRIAQLFLIVLGLTACGGGGGDSSLARIDRVVASISMVDGNNQTATVCSQLPKPLVVLIQNKNGQPIAGQVVNFSYIVSGKENYTETATSDANGLATKRWTLGTVAGVQKVEVSSVNSDSAAKVFASFDAIAVADAPLTISIASGNAQSAIQNHKLPLPVKILVKDAYGNPVNGVSVAFMASNGGSALPGSAITNASGEAEAEWTLGLGAGEQSLSAIVSGLPPINFSATIQELPGVPFAIVKSSGDLQSVVQHSLLPLPFQVVVTDSLGIPVSGTRVTFSAATENAYINPLTFVTSPPDILLFREIFTNSEGIASWTGYMHGAGLQKVNASVEGGPAVSFNTAVTPSDHLYDGLYFCSSFKFKVVNGILVNVPYANLSGTVSEGGGQLTATMPAGLHIYSYLSGRLMVDLLQRATGAGTYSLRDWYNRSYGEGSWTCDRQ